MIKLANPFVVGRYVSSEYFCDRAEETAFLSKQIVNGRNVALISPRRLGKTGLIQHSFSQEPFTKDYDTFFVDIYSTSSLAEFVIQLGKAVVDRLRPQRENWKERFFQIVRSLRVGLKVSSITGEPSFDISLGELENPQTTLDEIFEYLESNERPCVVAIDEFQQIGQYKEKNTEALLRAMIQKCKQTFFIFAGSRRHVMSNMFNSAAKPFYQSAICMSLEPIPLPTYSVFVSQLFHSYDKEIDQKVIERVYTSLDGCTWFMQMMMNELFALTPVGGICEDTLISQAEGNVIGVQSDSYKDMLRSLSARQKALLIAIAKEGKASGVMSAAFIKRHFLNSSSSVQVALKALLGNDIVTEDSDSSYRVYDYFFADWLRGL